MRTTVLIRQQSAALTCGGSRIGRGDVHLIASNLLQFQPEMALLDHYRNHFLALLRPRRFVITRAKGRHARFRAAVASAKFP